MAKNKIIDKYKISIEYGDNYYPIFLLGYTAEGGFFIQDIINDGKNFMILVHTIDPIQMAKFGKIYVSKKNCEFWYSKKSPKLTHHADGNVQISGNGITSGFYKFFKGKGPKGVLLKGVDLNKRNNDGGPILTFYLKNFSEIVPYKSEGIVIKKSEQIIDFFNKPKNEEDKAFSVEIFYFSKEFIKKNLGMDGNFSCRHPNYGVVPFKHIPSTEKSPGGIGIFTSVSSRDEPGKFTFSMTGGVGELQKHGKLYQICMIYPHPDSGDGFEQKAKNLDYNLPKKLKMKLDGMFFKLCQYKGVAMCIIITVGMTLILSFFVS